MIWLLGLFFTTFHFFLLDFASEASAKGDRNCSELTEAKRSPPLRERVQQAFQTSTKDTETIARLSNGVLTEHFFSGKNPLLMSKLTAQKEELESLGVKILATTTIVDLKLFIELFDQRIQSLVQSRQIDESDAFRVAQIEVRAEGALTFAKYGSDINASQRRYKVELGASSILANESFTTAFVERWTPLVESEALITANQPDDRRGSSFGLHSILFHDLMHAVGLLASLA